MANINNHGSTAAGGGLLVTGSNQSVGIIAGTGTPNSDGTTLYDGDTVVGDGIHPADLTATQILQNSLTITSGSTVTILPSGSGFSSAAESASNASGTTAVATAGVGTDSDTVSNADPSTAIRDAISSGAISGVRGEQLENRIAAIERLAATDPGLDVSVLEGRVLALLPTPSALSESGPTMPETGGSLLAVYSSTTIGSFSTSSLGGVSAAFAPVSGLGSFATVPEPSTLVLAALGGIGVAIAIRRRTIRVAR